MSDQHDLIAVTRRISCTSIVVGPPSEAASDRRLADLDLDGENAAQAGGMGPKPLDCALVWLRQLDGHVVGGLKGPRVTAHAAGHAPIRGFHLFSLVSCRQTLGATGLRNIRVL